jgi:hypothetical protein
MSERATFDLAARLRTPAGAPIGEVFSFLSGLYFRGKLTYAKAFARAPETATDVTGSGIFVITPSSGLRSPDTMLTLEAIRAFACVDVDAANPKYRRPLERSAKALAADITPDTTVVLLGSIASGKYVDVLQGTFGARLMFPQEFVGRGDMSRGGLLLRCAAAGQELTYVPVDGAIRHGVRPPKLDPATRVGSAGLAAPPLASEFRLRRSRRP